MKSIILTALILSAFSCRKFYHCDCTLIDPTAQGSGPVTERHQVYDIKKKAEKECHDVAKNDYPMNSSPRNCVIVN